ncbi:MAG: SPOR domain-containing protein, partial [Cellulophaga fucicola]
MPFIEEVDLLELHKDIDKAQLMNERLLDQIKYKNKELKRKRRQRNVLGVIAAVFFLGTLVFTSFSA